MFLAAGLCIQGHLAVVVELCDAGRKHSVLIRKVMLRLTNSQHLFQ